MLFSKWVNRAVRGPSLATSAFMLSRCQRGGKAGAPTSKGQELTLLDDNSLVSIKRVIVKGRVRVVVVVVVHPVHIVCSWDT